MPSIQGISYPVSAVVQSQAPAPTRETGVNPSAANPSATPATVSAQLPGVSNRVHAYLSTDRTSASRQDQKSSDNGASEGKAAARGAIDIDDAKNYKPNSIY